MRQRPTPVASTLLSDCALRCPVFVHRADARPTYHLERYPPLVCRTRAALWCNAWMVLRRTSFADDRGIANNARQALPIVQCRVQTRCFVLTRLSFLMLLDCHRQARALVGWLFLRSGGRRVCSWLRRAFVATFSIQCD